MRRSYRARSMPRANRPDRGDNVTTNEQAYNTNARFWMQIIRENRDRYRKGLTDPAILDAIGEAHGLAVLDANYDEGYMSHTLARNGTKVTGLDISAELIKAAK